MNAIQIEELYEAIDKVIKQKENNGLKKDNLFIVFFGANKISELGIRYLQEKNLAVSAIIDNSKEKKGMEKFGVRIFDPEDLLSDFKENAVIFVTSRYVKPMTEQLVKMGYEKNVHIFETIYHIPTLEIKEFESAIEKVKEGKEVYKNLNQVQDETLILCPYKGIGDIYFICAYLKQYCEKERISKYRLIVVGGACKKAAGMFEIKPISIITQREMDRIVKYISFVGISGFNVRILNHNYIHFNILSPFEEKRKISWGNMFIHGIMEFENITSMQGMKPKERAVDISPYKGLKEGRTVIFAPYANTVSNAESKLWERLAQQLVKLGYAVFTNSISETEPVINGTLPLSAPLEDMVRIIEYAGIFVGVRSGMCDLVSAARAKKIILYPDMSSLFFKMDDMGIAGDVVEICMYEKDNIEECILLEILKEDE